VVLLADIVGFTPLSARLSAPELVTVSTVYSPTGTRSPLGSASRR
jgi:hypothetical protein